MEPFEKHMAKISRRHFEPGVPVVLGVGILLAIALRLSLFDFTSADYHRFLSPWYDFIVNNGGFSALKYDFSNYTPPYLYLLTLAGYLPLPKLYAISWFRLLFLRSAVVQVAGRLPFSAVYRSLSEEARTYLLFPHNPCYVHSLDLTRLVGGQAPG
jgi:hypothetical protein